MADTEPAREERPIILLASGWRSGSTLLQRLLASHREVTMWGESRGLVDHLHAALEGRRQLEELSAIHRENLRRGGSAGWVPVLNPPEQLLSEGIRLLLTRYYATDIDGRHPPRWGFKEVRHDAEAAEFLLGLFPGARFVFLVRHPEDCLASARGTMRGNRGILVEAGGAASLLRHWKRLVGSFEEASSRLPARLVRYEDLIAEPERWTRMLAEFLELPAEGFDMEVFSQHPRGWKALPRLEPEDEAALRDPGLWEIARRVGYEPRGPARRDRLSAAQGHQRA